MKINFEKINKLKIIQQLEPFNFRINNNNYFYKTLFSIDNFGKNLLYLNLNSKPKENIDLNVIEFLNNFKLLEILVLSEFVINSLFTIKLNLIQLKLLSCKNITISEKCCQNIKAFFFCDCQFPKTNILLKFPEAEECETP